VTLFAEITTALEKIEKERGEECIQAQAAIWAAEGGK
jgi:hypothetical protein